MPTRLVAIDIDGTLLDSRWQMPPRNVDAIVNAAARGIEIAFVTGRRYDFAKPVLDLLPCPLTAIVSNGALVRLSDGTTPLRRLLPRETARHVLDETRPWRDSAGLVFDRPLDGQVVFERIDWSHPSRRAYAERFRPFIREVEPLEDALTEDPLQVMFNGPVASMRAMLAHLRGLPTAAHFSLAATEYEPRDFTLVDVLAPGCTKGSTLAAWAERQGYRREDVMALGDNLNDLEMLEAAGVPVVMGNAVPELLARGWHVTATNDEAGVAQAIERFVFDGGAGTQGGGSP
jgi:Cof subfamily protein (haloacid dehalogenase superfamily)